MVGIPERFKTHKYAVLSALVKDPTLSFFHNYAIKIAASDRADREDPQAPGTPSVYGDVLMETVLEELRPHVEQATSLQLYPTYAYFRVYRHGDVLTRHTDRPACEISLSLNLGYRGGTPWPILIEGPQGVSAVELSPGDAVLYRGIECFHWRDAFDGDRAAQAFLHYVDRNGPNAEWKFDKRSGLNGYRKLRSTRAGILLKGIADVAPAHSESHTRRR